MPVEGNDSRRSTVASLPILIVEDSENTAAMLEIALSGIPGVSVRLVSSGVEAWKLLSVSGDEFSAIVTDLNMPRMDGFELIRRVRDDQRLSATPIIVVSADTDPRTPERVTQLGVSAFFPKPYSPAEVRRKLEQILDDSIEDGPNR
ncbi:MAG TPA: response regulator [Verrucomicrobiae bacterium]|nr:response regulator [Verrucomicrobiae bacterium]